MPTRIHLSPLILVREQSNSRTNKNRQEDFRLEADRGQHELPKLDDTNGLNVEKDCQVEAVESKRTYSK